MSDSRVKGSFKLRHHTLGPFQIQGDELDSTRLVQRSVVSRLSQMMLLFSTFYNGTYHTRTPPWNTDVCRSLTLTYHHKILCSWLSSGGKGQNLPLEASSASSFVLLLSQYTNISIAENTHAFLSLNLFFLSSFLMDRMFRRLA